MTKTLVDISKYNTVTHLENKHFTCRKDLQITMLFLADVIFSSEINISHISK